jgi:membrane protease YdiL (CAAX protease family)
MALGPAVAGVGVTIATGGGVALAELGRSLLDWRSAPRHYAIALGLVPSTAFGVLGILWFIDPAFRPGVFGENGPTVLTLGVVYGIVAGGLEEIGWTGFAIRRLSPDWGTLRLGVVLGIAHGIWHLPAGYWGEGDLYGSWYLPYFILCWILGLVALRTLIAWLYARTGRVLLAQLAHASYTGGLLILWPTATTPASNVLWTGIFAATLSSAVLLLVLATARSDRLTGAVVAR